MKILITILKIFRIIPNIPFIIILCIYIVCKIIKETGLVELSMQEKPFLTDEIKEFIGKVYPKSFATFFAVFFYLYITLKYIFL